MKTGKTWPLGDSITWGTTTGGGCAYRDPMYAQAVPWGCSFVGTVTGGYLVGDTTTSGADGSWSGESASDYAGQGVAGGFDFDGDGGGDVLVGAYAASSYSGNVYLVYGPGTGDNGLGDAPVDQPPPARQRARELGDVRCVVVAAEDQDFGSRAC